MREGNSPSTRKTVFIVSTFWFSFPQIAQCAGRVGNSSTASAASAKIASAVLSLMSCLPITLRTFLGSATSPARLDRVCSARYAQQWTSYRSLFM